MSLEAVAHPPAGAVVHARHGCIGRLVVKGSVADERDEADRASPEAVPDSTTAESETARTVDDSVPVGKD